MTTDDSGKSNKEATIQELMEVKARGVGAGNAEQATSVHRSSLFVWSSLRRDSLQPPFSHQRPFAALP
jgi:hypothetical protein